MEHTTDAAKHLERVDRIIQEASRRLTTILEKESQGDDKLFAQLIQQTAFIFMMETGHQLYEHVPRYSFNRELADTIIHPAALSAFEQGKRNLEADASTTQDLAFLYNRVALELLQHLDPRLKRELMGR